MGRYVDGDWDWKFAFGDQDSSFGKIIEQIVDACDEEDVGCVTVSRYVGTSGQGEQVELYIEDDKSWNLFESKCIEFIGRDFKPKTDKEMVDWSSCKEKFGNEYWDKLMIWKFLKDKSKEELVGDTNYFYVEY